MKLVKFARHQSLKRAFLAGIFCVGATLGILSDNRVNAAQMGYTDLAQYLAATSGRTVTTLNFEGFADGTVIPSPYQGIEFDTANAVTGDLIFTNGSVTFFPGLNTFSATNYLGSDVGDVITESFSFTFQTPVNGVGLYIISSGQLFAGDVGISVGATSAVIDATSIANEITLSGNGLTTSYAYFLGIADTDPLATFSTVTVNPNITGLVGGVGIDNLSSTVAAVPEPSSLILLSLGSVAFIGYRAKKRSHSKE